MSLSFERNNNEPVWGGWIFVAMGSALALVVPRLGEPAPTTRAGLWVVAGVFALAGGAVVVRRFSQRTEFDPAARQVRVESRTRFAASERRVAFDDVAAVDVESWEEDRDARPMNTEVHRAVLRLRDGEAIPVTDFSRDRSIADGARARIAAVLDRRSA
jgi:hypothetical protein